MHLHACMSTYFVVKGPYFPTSRAQYFHKSPQSKSCYQLTYYQYALGRRWPALAVRQQYTYFLCCHARKRKGGNEGFIFLYISREKSEVIW